MSTVGIILYTILFILLFSLALLLCARLRLSISFKKESGSKPELKLGISILSSHIKKEFIIDENFRAHKKKDKAADTKDKKPTEDDKKNTDMLIFDKLKSYYGMFCDFAAAYIKNKHRIRRAILAEKTDVQISFGTGNAATTGIMTGAIWAAFYNVVAILARLITIRVPKAAVEPDYNKACFSLSGECIISTRPGYLIWVGLCFGFKLYLYRRKRKIKKGAMQNVKTD